MGYRRSRKTYHITYEEFPGLEIDMRSVPVGDLLDVLQLTADMGKQPTKAQMRKLFSAFTEQIVSWTYEDEDGKPLPPAVETLMAEDDFGFVVKLITGWVRGVTGQQDPTAGSEASGVEASIPMTAAAGT